MERSGEMSGISATKALSGIRVLALEGFIAGPLASMWLADMGAEVIKVEEPGSGDPARSLPPFKGEGDGRVSLSMLRANRNKKSIALNVKSPEGLAILKKLLSGSDVLIDNMRPDTLARLGLDWPTLQTLNPRLIYTSVSGFGHNDVLPGPYADWPAFDVVAQAMSGLMYRPQSDNGDPVYLGFPLADLFAASLAVTGTLQALIQRGVTGLGQRVDIAMYDAALLLNELAVTMQSIVEVTPKPGLHALASPFGSYRAKDGYLAIAVLGEKVWSRFCDVIGRADLLEDPSLADGISRHKEAQRLQAIIENWLSDKTRAQAVSLFVEHGVPAAPVQDTYDIVNCPQVAAREMLMEIDDPAWKKVMVVGQPIKLSASSVDRRPPPRLGEHTAQVLRDLAGIGDIGLDRLEANGIIGQ